MKRKLNKFFLGGAFMVIIIEWSFNFVLPERKIRWLLDSMKRK
jgi:hypothetical protein